MSGTATSVRQASRARFSGAISAVASLEIADLPFRGTPHDQPAESAAGRCSMTLRSGGAGDRYCAHAVLLQIALDGGLPVAAADRDRADQAAGASGCV